MRYQVFTLTPPSGKPVPVFECEGPDAVLEYVRSGPADGEGSLGLYLVLDSLTGTEFQISLND
jgi:hypothetical protein